MEHANINNNNSNYLRRTTSARQVRHFHIHDVRRRLAYEVAYEEATKKNTPKTCPTAYKAFYELRSHWIIRFCSSLTKPIVLSVGGCRPILSHLIIISPGY